MWYTIYNFKSVDLFAIKYTFLQIPPTAMRADFLRAWLFFCKKIPRGESFRRGPPF